jgi:hypothetical protein
VAVLVVWVVLVAQAVKLPLQRMVVRAVPVEQEALAAQGILEELREPQVPLEPQEL